MAQEGPPSRELVAILDSFWAQEGPKMSQEAPIWPRYGPKMDQDGPDDLLSFKAPKRHFGCLEARVSSLLRSPEVTRP